MGHIRSTAAHPQCEDRTGTGYFVLNPPKRDPRSLSINSSVFGLTHKTHTGEHGAVAGSRCAPRQSHQEPDRHRAPPHGASRDTNPCRITGATLHSHGVVSLECLFSRFNVDGFVPHTPFYSGRVCTAHPIPQLTGLYRTPNSTVDGFVPHTQFHG